MKAHGALYNMACRDEALAEAIARAVLACDPSLVLFGLPDSALIQAGLDAGLPVAAEAFADRAYHADGCLVSRSEPGSVIHDLDPVVARAVSMVGTRAVETIDGTRMPSRPTRSACTETRPGAALLAAAIRRGLEDAGVTVARLTR